MKAERMRAVKLAGAIAALLCASGFSAQNTGAPGAVPQQRKQTPGKVQAPIQVTTRLVHLVATVTDRHHQLVTDLDKKDFKLLEDGVPQDMTFFERETDLPLRIGLLLDTSNSIRSRLQFEQDAATDFLHSVIRRNKDDEAFLMTFDNEPEVIQDYTGDVGVLSDAIAQQRAGGGTALNDAICMAADKLEKAPPTKGQESGARRVLVVISDGEDNLSDHALSDAVAEAIRAEASIYAISTNTEWLTVDTDTPQKLHLTDGDKVLEQFAEQSGGRVFYPYKVEDLAQSFMDIGAELRSQYFIAYTPTNTEADGRYRKIEVLVDRKGLTVRTRKGYFAPTQDEGAPPAQ
jgi:VWFA-related protein